MLESAWLFVGAVAFGWTAITVIGAVVLPSEGAGDALATVGGVVGLVLWGVWTFGALNVVVVGEAVTFRFSHPSLALVGIAMALVPGYIALTGPIELVTRAMDGTRPKDI